MSDSWSPARRLAFLAIFTVGCTDETIPAVDTGIDGGDGDGDATGNDTSNTSDGDGDDTACGNGVVEGDEECDDGNTDNSDTCLDTCVDASCGDGHVGPGEGCDDGNTDDGDGCTSMCALDTCGDGEVQDGEVCDDGNQDDSDGCLNTCVGASCGDGHTWTDYEQCDDGNALETDACLPSCEAASCGDGIIWQGEEECDDSNADDADACLNSCLAASCGDGVTHAGVEECDDANDENEDACLVDCVLNTCGDGWAGPGEGCDDGNDVDGDECNNDCVPANCGDGVLEGLEECDDANGDNNDDCLNTCALPDCGDGFVWAGQEQCDDGNIESTDACTSTCEPATCGDGHVWANNEPCDDGNDVNDDDCLVGCVPATCGDGFLWQGTEACDDGNEIDDDGCEADCTLTPDPCGFGSTIYVDEDAVGNNDGTSWANAFTSPFFAMQSAAAADNIWIAEGTYVSIAMNAPVLTLKSCVDVYGGFAGNEGSLAQRPNPPLISRISGDFMGNDGANSFADNAYHAIVASAVTTIRLDGLTVSNGRASVQQGDNGSGAGLFAMTSTLSVWNSTFEGNVSYLSGGGIYSRQSMMNIQNTHFEGNRCTSQNCGGAGFSGGNGGGLNVANSTFVNNVAITSGGGMSIGVEGATLTNLEFTLNDAIRGGAISLGSDVTISDCTFINNDGNGAIYGGIGGGGTVNSSLFEAHTGSSAVTIDYDTLSINDSLFLNNEGRALAVAGTVFATRSEFIGNNGSSGGAVSVSGDATVRFIDVLFESNTASGRGGAISSYGGAHFGDVYWSDVYLHNVRLINNVAGTEGGAIYLGEDSNVTWNNVVISGNSAGGNGGAVYMTEPGVQGNMRHLSVYNNNAAGGGDGFYVTDNTAVNLVNSILWGNGGGDDFFGAEKVTITYTCSQEFLSIAMGNQIMLASPFDIGPDGELFLNQIQQNLCVNGGSDVAANASFQQWINPGWQNMTTAENAMLDVPPVDMGMHYLP